MANVEVISLADKVAAYQQVAATREGQIVIQDLVNKFGFSRTTLLNADPMRMAWNEGGRAVCVHIGRMVDTDLAAIEEQTAARGEEI